VKYLGWYNRVEMPVPRRWKYAIVFWALSALAVVLYPRYPWVDTIWMGLLVFAVVALSVHLVVKEIRAGGDERINARSRLGYPYWLGRFLRDDDEVTSKASAIEIAWRKQ
jgi:hypothetical protein